jgi:hypothetical protein
VRRQETHLLLLRFLLLLGRGGDGSSGGWTGGRSSSDTAADVGDQTLQAHKLLAACELHNIKPRWAVPIFFNLSKTLLTFLEQKMRQNIYNFHFNKDTFHTKQNTFHFKLDTFQIK